MNSHATTTMMRAALVTRYGAPEVLRIAEVPRPEPKSGELRIRVHATTVSSGDARVRSITVPTGFRLLMMLALGWRGPRQPVLGIELAGTVDSVGAGVTRFRVGDAVIAYPGASMRAHAEYVTISENGSVIPKPDHLDFEQAAALCFGGLTALHYLVTTAHVKAGERVLILGASGAVGLAAVQIARHRGAVVTAVCSGANAELVRDAGAEHVIDYAKDDFTKNGQHYDIVMDCIGVTSYGESARSLARGGRLLRVVAPLAGQIAALWQGRLSGHRVFAPVSPGHVADMRTLAELSRTGAYRPVIDSRYPLERIAAAHARVDSKRKRGSVVVTMAA
ncbi:MAG: NAD(P)-dependent alcohol dehydrogenase [Myxococcota bacterium]|nr:NAD(P)-dependent alcohol dehydrogenase [Myxococcota bacterium]